MPITDDFSAGISTALWQDLEGTWEGVGGGVAAGEAFVNAVLMRKGTFETDQYAQASVTVRRGGANASRAGVAIRVSTLANYYAAYLKEDTGGAETITDIELLKVVAGVPTVLGAAAVAGGNFGDFHTVKISATGTTIKAFFNGVEEISVVDTELTTGNPAVFEVSAGDTLAKMADDFETEGTSPVGAGDVLGDAAARFWILGPTTRKSRLAQHYRDWAERWNTVAADSFHGANTDTFLYADTGHTWLTWTADSYDSDGDLVVDTPIPSVFRKYQERMIPGRLVTGVAWAGMPMGRTDVVVRTRVILVEAQGEGLGISFRLDADGRGWTFHYHSDGHWRVSTISPNALGNGNPPTVNHETDLGTSPVLLPSRPTLLAAVTSGLTLKCYVDRAQVGSDVTLTSLGQYNTVHGIFHYGPKPNSFDNVTIWPKTR